jgi:hypothetical protein
MKPLQTPAAMMLPLVGLGGKSIRGRSCRQRSTAMDVPEQTHRALVQGERAAG